ncbi:MAG: hypothetical protein AB8F78_14145 [Saprospiraceae bacterium]
MKISTWKRVPEAAIISAALFLASCGSNVERVPVVAFTEGVVTEVEEVAPNDWRIADERVVADSNASRVISRALDGSIDTFSLAEVQNTAAPVGTQDSTSQRRYRHRSGFSTILLYGLIGNRMGAYNRGITPNARAYKNQGTYNRVQNSAGTRLNSSGRSRTISRPSSGRSGFGKSGGGRSYGG